MSDSKKTEQDKKANNQTSGELSNSDLDNVSGGAGHRRHKRPGKHKHAGKITKADSYENPI